MEIFVTKRGNKDVKDQAGYFKILDYKVLVATNNDLLLVQESEMTIEESPKKDAPLFEIFKVQFIASCNVEELKKGVIVAFYLGEYSCLQAYVLDGLPNNYYQGGDDLRLIDYKSYSDLCELTGETKLPLADYIKEAKSGSIGVNTFISYNEKFLNHDQQKLLWTELDATKIINN